MFFTVVDRDAGTRARTCLLDLPHGDVETPAFMPVGTNASVKASPVDDLERMGVRMILGNAYHLYLRPGIDVIKAAGGLHRFMAWKRNILTDSGGFQIFSLAPFRKIDRDGVLFRSHIDGSEHLLTPESATQIQHAIDADIIMAFDQPVGHPADRARAEEATARSDRWAARCVEAHRTAASDQALFGIVQGGFEPDLRAESARRITDLPFDGYAVGGLSVGEPKHLTFDLLAHTAPLLPADRPRYLMGMGKPGDIVRAVLSGIDMFDCVLPTRLGRNGTAYTKTGKINLKNARYQDDLDPLDPDCRCEVCATYSRAYLRHCYKSGEILAARCLSYHNLYLYLRLMEEIREAIRAGRYRQFADEALSRRNENG